MKLHVRLTPNADRDEVTEASWDDGSIQIKARVRAVPEKGKANKALIKLVADWLEIPKSDITLHSGNKSRIKVLHISGEEHELEALFKQALNKIQK